MRSCVLGILAVAAVLLCAPTAEAGTIHGVLRIASGKTMKPAAGKRVQVVKWEQKDGKWEAKVLAEAKTKSDGSFKVFVKPTGTFAFRVFERSYKNDTEDPRTQYPWNSVYSQKKAVRYNFDLHKVKGRWVLRRR